MNLLVSAYACCPGCGSEPGVGWNFVKEMSKRHRLTVLTRRVNQMPIETCGERWIESVCWIWYDPPKWETFWKRGQRGIQLFYLLWQIQSARYVRRSVDLSGFDRIHHITFGRYWTPSFLRRADSDPPLVFGPVGGGDQTPRGFRSSYSPSGRLKEWCKRAAEKFFAFLFRRRYKLVSVAIAATDETAGKLRRLVACPVSVFPQSALSEEDLQAMSVLSAQASVSKTPLFVTACRLVHWKAVELAVKAMPAVLSKLPEARLEIIGTGPERKRIEGCVRSLGLQGHVTFRERFPSQSDLHREIASATALVHPALHESFGQVCLEALALGTPVVCWRHGGPGVIAEGQPVASVPIPDDPSDLSGLASAMVLAWHRRKAVFPAQLTWSNWCNRVDIICSRELSR